MWYSWAVLLVLAAIYAQQQWSRYSLNYLYNTRADDDEMASFVSIAVSDRLSFAEYGILTGYGFSATFCIAGLVAGRLADVGSQRLIIFLGVAIWNAALVMMGYSNTFMALLCWRLVLGFGQAFTNPASYSLLADYFPEEKRSQANGLFACGVYVGGGLSSLCTSMAVGIGWRNTLFLIAAIGLALAAVEVVVVRDPRGLSTKPKSDDDDDDDGEEGLSDDASPTVAAKVAADAAARKKRSMSEAFSAIFSSRVVVLVFVAASLRFCGGYAIGGYLPTMYMTVFPGYETEYSYINAYVVAAGGFLSSWLGGLLADRWQVSEPSARLLLPALGCFGALPFMAITCLAPSFYASILVGLFFEYLIAECWFGPVVATMQGALDADCRALAIACFTLIATFWGSLASYVLGSVYDYMLGLGYPAQVIRWLVLWTVVASYVSSGLIFLYATRYMPGAQPANKLSETNPLLGDRDTD